MTKKEKLEKLLKEVPFLFDDYQNGIVRKYTPFGIQNLTEEELGKARARTQGRKLYCIIEQDMNIAGERVNLINYIIDMPGFDPYKHEYLSQDFYTTKDRVASIEDYTKVSYVFDSYCYNTTWNQMDHGEIGLIQSGDTVVRVW